MNNQIFRNSFVIIHRHLTKVSAQIIQCIIFERNKLSITNYSMVTRGKPGSGWRTTSQVVLQPLFFENKENLFLKLNCINKPYCLKLALKFG